jgi:hypothetical protein
VGQNHFLCFWLNDNCPSAAGIYMWGKCVGLSSLVASVPTQVQVMALFDRLDELDSDAIMKCVRCSLQL